MPSERWHRLERAFAEALELPAGARAEFLARECGPDHELRSELSELLAAARLAEDFLAEPALEAFARQISQEGWSVRPGDRIGSYTIDRRLGVGGMGEVWRARDARLGRDVAIKLLLPHVSNTTERVRALEHEARAAGTLNHVNVVTVYDVGEHRGTPYLVTECLEGESLRARLGRGPLPLGAALDVALQVARGLGAAHERGIVHGDLKPENVFLTADGRAKILDFALAAGTLGYMAPEQARGEAIDGRADIFALGVTLHESLVGRRPGAGLEPSLPPAVSALLARCLAESARDRFDSAADVAARLQSLLTPQSERGLRGFIRRPTVLLGGAVLLVAALALWLRWRGSERARWARSVAAPEVQRLMNHGDYPQAFLLARRALEIVPDDPLLGRLWRDVSVPSAVLSEPPGADVEVAPYEPKTEFMKLGRTPLLDVRIPRGLFRLRLTKTGFQPIEGTGSPSGIPRYRLDPLGTVPEGMVRVVGGQAPRRFGLHAAIDDFWLDKLEVTNQKYKEFVDRGGYVRREFWREPFVDGERTLAWDEAMLRFRDASGRAGPATWKDGTYPDGQADFPVGGVSWYEAAAYAAYAGKSLPSHYHWFHAASLGHFVDLLNASNFGGTGPARVGSHGGLGPFGTYDMAGNVREWAFNEMDHGKRFVLGGAWNDSPRMFGNSDAKGAFERAPSYGFRLAQYVRPPSPSLTATIRLSEPRRDARAVKPVSDEIFDVYRRLYAYDRSSLNVDLEEERQTEQWRVESVGFDAAYGGERMRAYLFLPKDAKPPYQTVVFFPPSDVFIQRSSRELTLAWGEPIVRSGRALVYPVYKGTYERRSAVPPWGANETREVLIARSRDLGRTIDYLETRTDLDLSSLTFYAVRASTGAVVMTALEPRLKFSVLQGAGVAIWNEVEPEVDAINFAPRIRIPTLMLCARGDFEHPVEAAQKPLFDLLGTPAGEKTYTLLEMGHGVPVEVGAREILPWLDRHLGLPRR